MIADKAARGGIENQTDFVADLGRNHFNQFTPAAAEFFNDGSRELFVNVNDNLFYRFQKLAVFVTLHQNTGARD